MFAIAIGNLVVGAFVAGASYYAFNRNRMGFKRAMRALSRAPIPIAEAPLKGVVHFAGRLRLGQGAVESPVSGRRCAAVCIRAGGVSDHTGRYHEAVREWLVADRCWIEDDTGRALVRPGGDAMVFTALNSTEFGEHQAAERAVLERIFTDRGVPLPQRPWFAVDELGERDGVEVVGRVRHEASAEGAGRVLGYRSMPMQTVVIPIGARGSVVLADETWPQVVHDVPPESRTARRRR